MTDGIVVSRYQASDQEAWDSIVRSSRNGLFMHERRFMEYHSDRFEDFSVLISAGGRPLVVFPANRDGDRIISHGGLTYGGLIYGMEQRAAFIRDAMQALLEFYAENGIKNLVYKAVPHIFHKYPTEEDIYALFLQNARLIRCDLSSAIHMERRPKFSSLRTRKVKKAVSAGVITVESTDFEKFHALLSGVLERHRAVPVHSADEMKLLHARFPEKTHLVAAMQSENMLAAAWVFRYDTALHFQYLSASESGRDMGALDLVISHVIETYTDGLSYVSFGASTEDGGRYLNEGLMFQKEGFGARSVTLNHYEIDLT